MSDNHPEPLSCCVVDDDPVVLELATELLTQDGFKVQSFDSAPAALAGIAADPPACVILDIMMPEMDGLEVCKRLRELEQLRSTKIIIHSSKSYEFDRNRFRVNLFRKDSGVGAVFRHIPNEVPTLDKLNVPDVLREFCDYHQGMVLVTGSTGTGKSTTLAAMIDHLNGNRNLNIISLEDPIEFVHPSKKSQVIQRELGTHLTSFADGVRSG